MRRSPTDGRRSNRIAASCHQYWYQTEVGLGVAGARARLNFFLILCKLVMLVLNEYDFIVIGTGSRMEPAFIQENLNVKIATIHKDDRALELQKKEGSRAKVAKTCVNL